MLRSVLSLVRRRPTALVSGLVSGLASGVPSEIKYFGSCRTRRRLAMRTSSPSLRYGLYVDLLKVMGVWDSPAYR